MHFLTGLKSDGATELSAAAGRRCLIEGGSRVGKGHKDKVAVITGGANGIGQAFAKRLAEDGVHIAVADMADGRETVNLVEAAGRQGAAVGCGGWGPDFVRGVG